MLTWKPSGALFVSLVLNLLHNATSFLKVYLRDRHNRSAKFYLLGMTLVT